VSEKDLALIFLSSHINKKNKKQEQIPDSCVQKKRMSLNVYGISNCNKMLLKPSREQALRNCFRGNLHGGQVICIGTEEFSVEKAAPYSYYLHDQKSHTGSICHLHKRYSAQLQVQRRKERTAQKTAQEGQAPVSDITELPQRSSAVK